MFLRLLLNAVALLLVARIFPGLLEVRGVFGALAAAFVMGLVNTLVKPLVVLLTLPLTVVTFGLFLLVINALMLLLVSWIVPGFEVKGFWEAIGASVILSLVSGLLASLVGTQRGG
ncbi:MAG: phage holin family protein [Deltaproteobacteria bacterium]|nr:MAG: phage holin family protein [Deltaproteobacteria bacterium]